MDTIIVIATLIGMISSILAIWEWIEHHRKPLEKKEGSMEDTQQLITEFNNEMYKIYWDAKGLGYHASWFKILIDQRGGLGAAKHLLGSEGIQTGFFELWYLDRLDLTVEHLAVYKDDKKFAPLFTADELRRAKDRLRDHEYKEPQ